MFICHFKVIRSYNENITILYQYKNTDLDYFLLIISNFKRNLSNFIFDFISLVFYSVVPGNYCERVIPDPIPNSEVKPFCADGTLS